MRFNQANLLNNQTTNYLYNGKELQQDYNLNWYDYGARFYDPAIGRFHTLDNFSEWFLDLTPYNYLGNNPITYVDPDGNFRTKFGAWFWSKFNGGGDILKDSGGEYFVSQHAENEGDADITYKRTFDRNGRSQGKDLKLEKALELYKANLEFSRTLDQCGIQYTYTNDINEARMGMLKLSTSVILPNTIKATTSIVNSTKNAGSSVDELIQVANQADKGGLTRVGGALQKHGSRAGSSFTKVTGNPVNMNTQGQKVLEKILTNPGATRTTRYHARFGNVMEVKNPGGQGARFSADGKKFIGFLE